MPKTREDDGEAYRSRPPSVWDETMVRLPRTDKPEPSRRYPDGCAKPGERLRRKRGLETHAGLLLPSRSVKTVLDGVDKRASARSRCAAPRTVPGRPAQTRRTGRNRGLSATEKCLSRGTRVAQEIQGAAAWRILRPPAVRPISLADRRISQGMGLPCPERNPPRRTDPSLQIWLQVLYSIA